MKRMLSWCRANAMPVLAVLAAAITAVFVPPDGEYLGYYDLRTLACLLAMLAVVCALRRMGLFSLLAEQLLRRFHSAKIRRGGGSLTTGVSPTDHYQLQQVPGYESDRFRLAIYDRAAKKSTILTEKFDNMVDDYKWAPDSKSIYFIGEVQGAQPLYKLDIAKKTISPVIAGKAISEFDFDNKGMVYYAYSTTGKPSALYRQQMKKWNAAPVASGKEQQITFLNQKLEEEVDIRPSESIWVDGAAGDKVQVFIVKPHDFDPAKKYPLIINVHGGPQMQWMNSFRGDWQVYPGAGYVVAYPNPHGSTGYGQAFTRAISGDWGGKVFEDIMKVTDKLATLEYVDSTRMGAMGHSEHERRGLSAHRLANRRILHRLPGIYR